MLVEDKGFLWQRQSSLSHQFAKSPLKLLPSSMGTYEVNLHHSWRNPSSRIHNLLKGATGWLPNTYPRGRHYLYYLSSKQLCPLLWGETPFFFSRVFAMQMLLWSSPEQNLLTPLLRRPLERWDIYGKPFPNWFLLSFHG